MEAQEKFFEVPVTIFIEDGSQDFRTFISRGEEEPIRMRVARYLEEQYPGGDYDYDVIEISPEEYESLQNVEYLPDSDNTEEEYDEHFGNVGGPRDMEDEMEDLTDRYYTLEDKLNSIPAEGLDEQKVTDARMELNKAKDYFDQYDFFACKDSLNKADAIITELAGG